MSSILRLAGAIALVVSSAVVATSPARAHVPRAESTADLDGDGFEDLAVGIPGEGVDGIERAGAVAILSGGSGGTTAVGDVLLSQLTDGVKGRAQPGDGFGDAVATGDFDGDGFDDLAVGAPFEDVDTKQDAGSVNVLYGSSSGIGTSGDRIFAQDTPGVPGLGQSGDLFGLSLATGDFDGDGFSDLAVGVPAEDVQGQLIAGAVNVLFGGGAGLSDAGSELWHQDRPGVQGVAQINDAFGSDLASGDFDDDGFADLAVGAPRDLVGDSAGGVVTVLVGSSGGLSAAGDDAWHRGRPGVKGSLGTSVEFGRALGSADFDGDGFADLAVGSNGHEAGNHAGGVNVLHGSGGGLTAAGDQHWTQDSPGVKGVAENVDGWGFALAGGDADGDGFDDLAVAAVSEDVGTPETEGAGAVSVLYGTSRGLSATGDDMWHQDVEGVEGRAQRRDAFGSTVAFLDVGGDGRDDLLVGVPAENIEGEPNAGVVQVLYGSVSGITATGDRLWHQGIAGVRGEAQDQDRFGATVGDSYSESGSGVPIIID